MSTVIRFDHVSKRFRLNHHSRTLQELLLAPFRHEQGGEREFWPLRDVSFEVEAGETVGIIGPNGVGKSTILKLIARILEPTSGTIERRGRIGTLLELGAGFHPDLTGRENIYLNGAVLGMSKAEIKQKFDRIVEFAGLGAFIDMPVKHYSSGMYVRLGFSIAIHAEPDILLVDEVLAVGDAAFQRKCLEEIDAMHERGVTILFVSHAVEAIRAVCSRALWLSNSRIVADGEADAVVRRYLDHTWRQEEGKLRPRSKHDRRWGSGKVLITQVDLVGQGGEKRQQFKTGEPMTIVIHYQAHERIEHPVFGLAIHRSDGVHVTGPNTRFSGLKLGVIEGEGTISYTIPSLPLLKGLYYISVAAHDWEDQEIFDYHNRLYPFRVLPSEKEKHGLMTLQGQWEWPNHPLYPS